MSNRIRRIIIALSLLCSLSIIVNVCFIMHNCSNNTTISPNNPETGDSTAMFNNIKTIDTINDVQKGTKAAKDSLTKIINQTREENIKKEKEKEKKEKKDSVKSKKTEVSKTEETNSETKKSSNTSSNDSSTLTDSKKTSKSK